MIVPIEVMENSNTSAIVGWLSGQRFPRVYKEHLLRKWADKNSRLLTRQAFKAVKDGRDLFGKLPK